MQVKYQNSNVAIYAKGNIAGTPIIFIHGNSLSAQIFVKQFEGVDNIPLLAFDMPGHGNSEKPENPAETYSLPGLAGLLAEIVKQIGCENYILCGHSLGGHVAIEVAAQAANCAGIFICGAPPIGMPPALDKAFLPNPVFGSLFKQQLQEEEITALAAAMVDDEANAQHLQLIKQMIESTDGNFRAMLGASIAERKHGDEIKIVSELTIPIAIMHGSNDKIVSYDYLTNLDIPLLWQNTIHKVDSGHSIPLENPEAYNALLVAFYKEVFNSSED